MKKRGILKNSKGQMRVIESIMAALIVVSAIVFLYTFAATPSGTTYEAGELEKIGSNILHDIDQQRLLSRFVYNGEWANLTAALVVSVPNDVYFNLTVYDINGNAIGHPLVQYGNSQMFISSKTVATVTYILSGYQSNYSPRVIVLKLVRA